MNGHAILPPVADSKDARPRRATYEDLLKVPDHLIAEIIDGVLYASPRPAPRHAGAATNLTLALSTLSEGGGGPGGWRFFHEPELHLGLDTLVPDIAAWRIERMPQFPKIAFFTLAPDWVCEVQSPSNSRPARENKLRVYARHGVPHAWLVDPKPKTLEVLSLDGSNWRRHATYSAHDRVRAIPFDSVNIGLAYLWGEPETPAKRP
jgi:Uma2 family endonuclease